MHGQWVTHAWYLTGELAVPADLSYAYLTIPVVAASARTPLSAGVKRCSLLGKLHQPQGSMGMTVWNAVAASGDAVRSRSLAPSLFGSAASTYRTLSVPIHQR